MSNRLPADVWHMKNQKMLVIVKGMSVVDEISPINFAGNLWSYKAKDGKRYTPQLGRGPQAVESIKQHLITNGNVLPEHFGTYIDYGDEVVFHDSEVNAPLYIRVGDKHINVVCNATGETFSFYTGKSHKNYHMAMKNALKLVRSLAYLTTRSPPIK